MQVTVTVFRSAFLREAVNTRKRDNFICCTFKIVTQQLWVFWILYELLKLLRWHLRSHVMLSWSLWTAILLLKHANLHICHSNVYSTQLTSSFTPCNYFPKLAWLTQCCLRGSTSTCERTERAKQKGEMKDQKDSSATSCENDLTHVDKIKTWLWSLSVMGKHNKGTKI